ncbi:MAG: GNAT family N-acetyltransferase [Austwickia sp.]|nr:GNAT family N-acetyltransferase [Austwickia sp.]MBK8436613.1 GNAT family N-acetyltransferase [Austwickia sp.]MBK9102278.1 GNAT family N-acetyltransferase [Austwickia sp.]
MLLTELDMNDPVLVEHYWRVRETALTAGRPRYQASQIEDFVEIMALHDDHFDRTVYGAYDGSLLVGAAMTLKPTAEGCTDIWAWPYVPPVYRRDGVGSMLFEAIIEEAQKAGRTRLMSTIEFAGDSLSDAARHPYVAFARHNGFTIGRRMIRWELRLPVEASVRESFGAVIAARAKDYRVEVVEGMVPPARTDAFQRLRAAALDNAPGQEMCVSPESIDAAAYQATTQMWLGQGHRIVIALAYYREPQPEPAEGEPPLPPADPAADELVGFSTVRIPPKPELAVTVQGDTWVDEAHRRRRVGPALKLAVADWLTSHVPERTRIQTQTAEINRRMASLNRAVGYAPIETMLKITLRVDPPKPEEGA